MMTRPHSLLRPWAQGLLLAAAAILIGLPSADWRWHFDPTPAPQENRRLAAQPPPPRSLDQWVAWPALFEAYFKDWFGLRASLIAWHGAVMLDILGVSPSKDVLVGKDGWLYYATSKTVDAYRCVAPYTPQELHGEVREARRRMDWLAAKKIRYGHIWVPIKANIYPEFLPDGLHKLNQPCRLQQWIAAVGGAGVPVLDLTKALQAAKAAGAERLYYKTDSHWNPLGAWHGYRAAAPWLAQLAPGMRVLKPEEVTFEMRSDRGGDLARLLDMQERYRTVNPFVNFRPARAVLVANALPPAQGVNVKTFDCNTCGNTLRVVVIHDSFGNGIVPYLAESFGHLVGAEFSPFDEKLIESEKPDLVLEVHLERQLSPNRTPP